MSESTFDIISVAMSYWFAALIAYILIRVIGSVIKEFSREKLARQHSEGYSVGVLEVVSPVDNQKIYGQRFPLKRENRIGRARKCDICLRDRSVSSVQAMIYQKGGQIMLADYGARQGVTLNGKYIARPTPLIDGDEIGVSDVLLLLTIRGGAQSARNVQNNRTADNRADRRSYEYNYSDDDQADDNYDEDNYDDEYDDEYGEYDDEYDDDNYDDDEYDDDEYDDDRGFRR